MQSNVPACHAISVKKSNGAEGTQQLCAQMDAVHMSADGSM